MKFKMNQLVKSVKSNAVYRLVNIDHNLYSVEGENGEVEGGCDDDFVALKNTDPVYWDWVEKGFK